MRLVGRRLPDVLIGILIVVLALGLGSLLLTQRNRAATLPSEPSVPADTATIPTAPGTSEVTSTPAPASTSTVSTPTAESTTPTPSAPTATAPAPSGAADSAAGTDQASTAPAAPEAAPTASTAQAPTTQTTTTQASPVNTAPQSQPNDQQSGLVPTGNVQAPVTPQPNTTAPPVATTPPASAPQPSAASAPSSAATVTSRSGGPVATSADRTPLKRDYRISLGTFGSVSEAQASTKDVQALGYTVYPIDLGSQVVAQVGPFADAQSANAALSDIQRVYGGALVYAPRQSATGTSTADTETPAASTASSAQPAAQSASPTAQPAAAPSGPVYLQVGAFDRQDSAQRLVGMLSDLGYSPSVQAPEGQKVRVLIGPFSGDAVVQAENKLNDNGFDHFRVR